MPTAAFGDHDVEPTEQPRRRRRRCAGRPRADGRRRRDATPSEPAARTRSSVSSSPCRIEVVRHDAAPAAASAAAMPRPIPEPAPVIAATVPSRVTGASSRGRRRGVVGRSGSASPEAPSAATAALSRSSHVHALSGVRTSATSSNARNARDLGERRAGLGQVAAMDEPTSRARLRPGRSRPAAERCAADLGAGPRVVDHERRARIALEVRGPCGCATSGQDTSATAHGRPHGHGVRRPVRIEGGEDTDEPRLRAARARAGSASTARRAATGSDPGLRSHRLHTPRWIPHRCATSPNHNAIAVVAGRDAGGILARGTETSDREVCMATSTIDSALLEALTTSFSGTVLLPGDDGYDEARRVHNGLIDRRPALIARCQGTADIAEAIGLARVERPRDLGPRRRPQRRRSGCRRRGPDDRPRGDEGDPRRPRRREPRARRAA